MRIVIIADLNNYINRNIIEKLKINLKKIDNVENFPMLPVQLFKHFDLLSVKREKVVKKLISSGTSGQNPSKIYLDKNNA